MIRERSGRMLVEISCWLEGPEGVSCVTTLDLSDTGLSMLSSDPLPEGRIVRLKFFTPFAAEPVALNAEVVWSRTEPEGVMGLRFLDMDEKIKVVMRETVRLQRMRSRISRLNLDAKE
jgi:c-di-GMP-binding flagellar brake protein YcgR